MSRRKRQGKTPAGKARFCPGAGREREELRMKKLMIMGAGIYQVPLIRKAREMGIYTIAVSIPGNYPALPWQMKCVTLIRWITRRF